MKLKIYFFTVFSFIWQSITPCSIIGYIGDNLCKSFILQGLSRLEYRGYDSAGYCAIDPYWRTFVSEKAVGKLAVLKKRLFQEGNDGYIGIGHTRWATHGPATEINAHPHFDCNKTVALVHNGIIENFEILKKELQKKGHKFISDTDSEVIAHLLEGMLVHKKSTQNNIKKAVQDMAQQLEGSFAFISILRDNPNVMIAMRHSSPLVIGKGDNEMFVASDVLAFADKTNDALFLPDESFALIFKDKILLYDFDGNELEQKISHINVSQESVEKKEHEHYMLKEILEQPHVIRESVKHYQDLGDGLFKQFGISKKQAKKLQSIHLIGCGTSWHAALIGKFFFEYIAKIPTVVHLASEFRYMPLFPQKNSLYIGISQSGETADTLEALRLVKKQNVLVSTLTNVPTSTMVRETNGYLQTKAGPEIAVASTKAFTTQITALYWLAHIFAQEKRLKTKKDLEKVVHDVNNAADVLEQSIEKYKHDIMNKHAKKFAQAQHIMFLGRHNMYPLALESSLKLKEVSYIPSHGGPAGELKHGTLALVDFSIPVIMFTHPDQTLYKKVVANAQEVKARDGQLIVCAFEDQKELCDLADVVFTFPHVEPLLTPLAMSGLMQLFSYAVAKELKRDIDMPRNLAKSVTVE